MSDNENMDFAALFEQSLKVNMKIKNGDKVSGTVIMIGKDDVFVNIGGRQDGVMDIKELIDENGDLTVKVGDVIEAFAVGSDSDGVRLKKRLATRGAGASAVQMDTVVADAFAKQIPIEGKVTGERKGGFTVQVASAEAFCPFSQIDGRGVRKEPAEYIGQTFAFLVTECSEEGRNVVLSRRKLMDKEEEAAREKLMAVLEVGAILPGRVSNIMPYGAFVDLGGLEGMVHVSEVSYDRGVNLEECLTVGQKVDVKVLSITETDRPDRPRLSLSIKQAGGDPWQKFLEDPAYATGTRHNGVVTRLADFGAFIRLPEAGIEGLAHISQLGAEHRIEHPSELLKVGDEVQVTILDADSTRRRLSLCVGEPKAKADDQNAEAEAAQTAAEIAGQTLEGVVEKQMPFGLFVKLPDGRTGLLHISQLGLGDEPGQMRERMMYRQHPLHSTITVVVRDVAGDRISLTTPQKLSEEAENSGSLNVTDEGSASFGSLGDMLGNLKL